MSSPRTLRCTMKMRTCGLFWHKVVVSLKFASRLSPDQPRQALLTITRPKLFGGKLEMSLANNTTSLISVSGKEARHYQLKIRYGPRFQIVTLRAPNSAIYETWWAALENALASPNFVVLPVIDARACQVNIAPVLPTRRNIPRSKHTTALETVVEVVHEDESVDDTPMLEANGPSSPTETDILASWRTWASLDYFATPPTSADPLSSDASPEAAVDDSIASGEDDSSDRISTYSDISEFWSRPSEWEDEIVHDAPAAATSFANREPKSPVSTSCMISQPQDDDDKWLDEIALFTFRQKVGAGRKSERRPIRRVTGRLHPLLTYALL